MEVIWKCHKGDFCFPTAQAVSTHWPQLEAGWESGCHRQRGRVSERPGLTFLIIDPQPVESWEAPAVHWHCAVFRLQKKPISFRAKGCTLLTGSHSGFMIECHTDSSKHLNLLDATVRYSHLVWDVWTLLPLGSVDAKHQRFHLQTHKTLHFLNVFPKQVLW